MFGPTALGEYWKARIVKYDPLNDQSRVGFDLATEEDQKKEIGRRLSELSGL